MSVNNKFKYTPEIGFAKKKKKQTKTYVKIIRIENICFFFNHFFQV